MCVCGCELGLCSNFIVQIVKPFNAAAYVFACGWVCVCVWVWYMCEFINTYLMYTRRMYIYVCM